MSLGHRALCAALVAVAALALSAAPDALAAGTLLIDVPPIGLPLPADDVASSSLGGSRVVSADGNYVVFASSSDGLSSSDDDIAVNLYRKSLVDGTVVQVNVPEAGVTVPPGGIADQGTISSDGSVVAFRTSAALDPADTNNGFDVYKRTIAPDGTGTTELVSCPDTGVCHGDPSVFVDGVAISGSGAVVAWRSSAALATAPGGNTDTDNFPDVYGRAGPNTFAISVGDDGNFVNAGGFATGPVSINEAGTRIAFETSEKLPASDGLDANSVSDVYVRLRVAGPPGTRLMSRGAVAQAATPPAIGGGAPSISSTSNPLRVAFTTTANIGADANGVDDVYVMNLNAAETVDPTLVSAADGVGTPGTESADHAAISGDGSRIGFLTRNPLALGAHPQNTHKQAYVRTPASNSTALAGRGSDGSAAPGDISNISLDGGGDVAVFDHAHGALTADASSTQTVVYARRLSAGTTANVSRPAGTASFAGGAGSSLNPAGNMISADRRYVVFDSEASDLIPGVRATDRGIYRRDLTTGQLERVDVGIGGAPDGASSLPSMSLDGTKITFTSNASNLVPGDTNGKGDVFVRDLVAGTTRLLSTGPDGTTPGNDHSGQSVISGDGNRVAFTTSARLDPVHDTDAGTDDYAADTSGGAPVLVSRPTGADTMGLDGFANVPSISRDGNRIAFDTVDPYFPTDLAFTQDVFVRELSSNTTTWVTNSSAGVATAGSSGPRISADGNRVAFSTNLGNLGDGDTDTNNDIHVADLAAGSFIWATRKSGADGGPLSSPAFLFTLAPAGDKVVFDSSDDTIVTPDTNAGDDVFARDLTAQTTTRVLARPDGSQPKLEVPFDVLIPTSISTDGSCLVLSGRDPLLVAGGYKSSDFTHVYLVSLSDACKPPEPPIVPTPSPTPTPTPVSPKDTTKPRITKLKFAKKTIRTRKAKTKKGKKAPLGTTLSLTLSEDATVTVTIERETTGRKVGSKCVKQTKSNRKKKKCTRRTKAGKKITARGKTGSVKIKFKPTNLADGSYRVVVTATDAAGNKSSASHASFKVIR